MGSDQKFKTDANRTFVQLESFPTAMNMATIARILTRPMRGPILAPLNTTTEPRSGLRLRDGASAAVGHVSAR
jgi:hypothetical protein